jgi:drug/metabolite transporter (DMT)-like permease
MTKLLIILFIALTFETAGVILLSKGLRSLEGPKNYSPSEIVKLVGRGLSSPHIVVGVAFEAVFFIGLLMMMSNADVSFVFSTIAARFYLHEQIDPLRWAGVMLIVLGAGLITFTEKKKEAASVLVHSAEPRI